jgi:hypothetical protein
VLCTEVAQNPEIAILQQHQDPASEGAAALNKQIVLDLAVQLASIGADPQLALLSGTFEPGDVSLPHEGLSWQNNRADAVKQLNDATGAGNTCDDLDDPVGCIETLNLRVDDATAEEIDEAVAAAGAGGAGGAAGGAAGDHAADDAAGEDDAAEGAAGNEDGMLRTIHLAHGQLLTCL